MKLPPIWWRRHGNRWKLLKNPSVDRAWSSCWAPLIKGERVHPTRSVLSSDRDNGISMLIQLWREKSQPTRRKSPKLFCFRWFGVLLGEKNAKVHCLEKKQKKTKNKGAVTRPSASTHIHTSCALCVTWTARKKLGPLIALWWSVISGLACLSWEAAFEWSAVVRSGRKLPAQGCTQHLTNSLQTVCPSAEYPRTLALHDNFSDRKKPHNNIHINEGGKCVKRAFLPPISLNGV